jgi:hypothetical protein
MSSAGAKPRNSSVPARSRTGRTCDSLAGVTMNSHEIEEIIVKLQASGVTIGSDP